VAMRDAAKAGKSNAVDLADWLVQNLGTPFRQAHHITGQLVRLAEEKGCGLEDLSIDDMQSVEKGITDDVFRVLDIDKSIAMRNSLGGPAPDRVRKAVIAARRAYLED